MERIQKLLDKEIEINALTDWNKMNNNNKIKKLENFSISYCKNNKLNNQIILFDYLKKQLFDKRISNIKDIIYDNDTNEIISIPQLIYKDGKYYFNIIRNNLDPLRFKN
tara:strand:- start:71 stop:397 length:327 start_codon:yes stop_codon:yes gene_type:complete